MRRFLEFWGYLVLSSLKWPKLLCKCQSSEFWLRLHVCWTSQEVAWQEETVCPSELPTESFGFCSAWWPMYNSQRRSILFFVCEVKWEVTLLMSRKTKKILPEWYLKTAKFSFKKPLLLTSNFWKRLLVILLGKHHWRKTFCKWHFIIIKMSLWIL